MRIYLKTTTKISKTKYPLPKSQKHQLPSPLLSSNTSLVLFTQLQTSLSFLFLFVSGHLPNSKPACPSTQSAYAVPKLPADCHPQIAACRFTSLRIPAFLTSNSESLTLSSSLISLLQAAGDKSSLPALLFPSNFINLQKEFSIPW